MEVFNAVLFVQDCESLQAGPDPECLRVPSLRRSAEPRGWREQCCWDGGERWGFCEHELQMRAGGVSVNGRRALQAKNRELLCYDTIESVLPIKRSRSPRTV